MWCILLYQTHYVWMYDNFMLKTQAAKYFSKILKTTSCLAFIHCKGSLFILARAMLIEKIFGELFNPVLSGHVTG